MSSELIQSTANTEIPDLMGQAKPDVEDFNSMVRPGYMGRVQLCGSSSSMVTEQKMQVGMYAYIRSKDDFVDFGKEFNCIPFAYRFAAMRFDPEKTIVNHDSKSDEFKEIRAESVIKDSKCAYGVQFLIWLPALKEFATFFCGSKSARPEARKIEALRNKASTFRAKLVSNVSYKWWVPTAFPCSAELTLPNMEVAAEVVAKFMAEKSSVQEEEAPASATPAEGERPR